MPLTLHTQTVIACVWDFDRTLIPGYSQQVLFDEYGVDAKKFWDEVKALPVAYGAHGIRVAEDTAYLGHMLTYVQHGIFKHLSNERMKVLGAKIRVAPGMPDFFDRSRSMLESDDRYKLHGLTLEHYVVSTGVRPLIEGSIVGSKVDDIWANEFIENPIPPGFADQLPTPGVPSVISQIGYMLDNTSKTRAIFEINKGVNKLPGVNVNTLIPPAERRVPINNMIYIGDGPSDIPVFSVLHQFAGHNLAVYSTEPPDNFAVVKSLQDQGRVQMIGPADFGIGSVTERWLTTTIQQIATRIVETRERYLNELPGAPGHVTS